MSRRGGAGQGGAADHGVTWLSAPIEGPREPSASQRSLTHAHALCYGSQRSRGRAVGGSRMRAAPAASRLTALPRRRLLFRERRRKRRTMAAAAALPPPQSCRRNAGESRGGRKSRAVPRCPSTPTAGTLTAPHLTRQGAQSSRVESGPARRRGF